MSHKRFKYFVGQKTNFQAEKVLWIKWRGNGFKKLNILPGMLKSWHGLFSPGH